MARAPSALDRGRQAFAARSWRAARDELAAARDAETLDPDDLWRLGLAGYLIGDERQFERALEEAYQARVEAGQARPAARCAFWLGFHMAGRGDPARASGWFGRAARRLGQEDADCAESAYLLLPVAHQHLAMGDPDSAYRTAADATARGQRFGEADLLALSLHIQGRALLRLGRIDEGLSFLDEAMVSVVMDELSPHVTGLVYCSVIGACREIQALDRTREWTLALSEWCERQPDMVAYSGECRTFRAEILQREGRWDAALAEARRALEPGGEGAGSAVAGLALYQQGETHRLRGAFADAEAAYRAASRAGHDAQPGLALLRLAQGDAAAALAATRRGLAETSSPFRRARLLPAHIEIALAADASDEARRALGELTELATCCARGMVDAAAAQAEGAIELHAGRPAAALAPLRRAWEGWVALDAPYDAARARLLLGLACRALGDADGSALELEAARDELARLGAAPDVARIDAILGAFTGTRAREHGLTPREREVLALVATGRTNRAIADELFISERTVARHVANIFGKLGISSRAAATAFAYEHDLLEGP